jgi:hypothetical protein
MQIFPFTATTFSGGGEEILVAFVGYVENERSADL